MSGCKKDASSTTTTHKLGRSDFEWDRVKRASDQVRDFAAPHVSLCRSLEELLQGVLEVMALKDVRVAEEQCRLRGAPLCELSAVWRP